MARKSQSLLCTHRVQGKGVERIENEYSSESGQSGRQDIILFRHHSYDDDAILRRLFSLGHLCNHDRSIPEK